MKDEKIIRDNLNIKKALLMASVESPLTPESKNRLIEHIKMLDWVLSEHETTRPINEIIEEQ